MRVVLFPLPFLFFVLATNLTAMGQSEVTGWGNLRGIRTDGQLIPFTTAVGIYDTDFKQVTLSQREGPTRTTHYSRDNNTVTVGVTLRQNQGGVFNYTIQYTDTAPGRCDVHIELTSVPAQTIGGIYYFITLPASASLQLADPPTTQPDAATSIRISCKNNTTFEIDSPQPVKFVPQYHLGANVGEMRIYFPIHVGNTTAGQTIQANFTIKTSAPIETTPVLITVDPKKLGRTWQGIGGNYRIQNQRLDAQHIQYIMDNMRVAYGRVAIPWNAWQPEENSPPATTGTTTTRPSNRRAGAMNSVSSAMAIAQKLAKQNIPMIISCWSAPDWALMTNDNGRRQRLDPAKWDKICQSIGSYLTYLKTNYSVEPQYFSFNESNIGINVLQTPADHDQAIKKLGTYFQSIGLKTKMLLGDTGDAPPINFIQPALNDPDAIPYIGAISFHSWRGATDAQYQKWSDAATKLNVPLFDAEGGNDAQAYAYPNIFREQWYALDEAAEYVRIMKICQPAAILQWQLTENYSVLSTDANGELRPTQRFFNLKQFNLAPAGATWISTDSSDPRVLATGFAKNQNYTIHLVNNGATRPVTLTGLPAQINSMDVYVTDKDRGMKKIDSIKVTNGFAQFELDQQTLTTLTNAAN